MGGIDPGASLSRLPEQFGKYSILGHLATGGMADVYIARQGGLEGFEKIVVIKTIRPELTLDAQTTTLFLDEARLVATLEHPNIAQVYEIGLVNGAYFLVMEYVHGADLRQVLAASARRERHVALADCVYIISHVCAALHYAHEKHDLDGNSLHIIHRDISPSNVLLSHDGAVKVCDFGIAKATRRSEETQRGVLKGKFAYMSPEQCKAEALDRRSDVFSIGILLYELSTLTRLFKAGSDFELLRMIVENPIPPPSSRVKDYSPELERIVMRALARDPADRYQTAQEMQLDLEELAREQKLKMSSVNIARLMGELFEKSSGAWSQAIKSGRKLEDALMDTAVRGSDRLPVFMPVGSDQDLEIEAAPGAPPSQRAPERRSSMKMPAVERVETTPPTRARSSPAWLVGAIVCGLAAAGITVAANALASNNEHETDKQLASDVERIAATLDTAARTAHERADAIAATPMLRTAIETDAATLRDLAENEYAFPLRRGEVAEIFQVKGGVSTSLLRLPANAQPIDLPKGQGARILTDGKELSIVATSPIESTKHGLTGMISVAVPVDLAGVRRGLADHVTRASLAGLRVDIPLVPGADGGAVAQVKLAIPATGDASESLALVAVPVVTASALPWVDPARYAAVGLAALLLVMYLAGFRRRTAGS